MKILNAFRFAFALWFLGLSGLVATAQTAPQQQEQTENSYPKEKLKKFVDASKDISTIHQEGEEKMISAIEKENLDIETFNKIAELKMNPQEADAGSVSPEEVEAFDRVMPELQLIQIQMQQEMESAIKETGMEVEEYTEIMEAYRSDPELQAEINSMLME
jgi:hypothetical protein